MVETPTATAIIKTSPPEYSDEDPDSPLMDFDEKDTKVRHVEQELLLVRSKPITAKIRTTIRHLRSRAGFLSRFRGISMFVVWITLSFAISRLMAGLSMHSQASPFLASLGSAILCRFHAAWTHIVISEPSEKRWYQRLPERKQFKKLFFPTLLHAFAIQFATQMTIGLFRSFDLHQFIESPERFSSLPDSERHMVIAKFVLVHVFGLANLVLIAIPASVMLTRVQASMLPEDCEPIVPFDRTYGGLVKSVEEGGKGRLWMTQAWKTFDWNSRMRLMKFYVKTLAVQTLLGALFIGIAVAEVQFIMGDQLQKMMAIAKANMQN